MPEQIFTNCTVGGPIFVHVRDSKIVRIRSLVYAETDASSWTIKARGKQFTPPNYQIRGCYNGLRESSRTGKKEEKHPQV